MRSLTCGLLALAVFACSSPAHARTWRDRTGKHEIEAEFVELQGGKVVLKKPDGKQIAVLLTQLSDADQQFLQKQAPAPARASQTDAAPVHVEVMGVSITRPMAESLSQEDKQAMMMAVGSAKPGARIRLLLSSSTKQFVGMDRDACRLTRFVDDKGTVLTPAEGGEHSGFPTFSGGLMKKGHLCAVEIRVDRMPANGATKLIAQGEVVLRCGEGEKTLVSDPLDLAAGGNVNLGSTSVTVKEAKEGSMGFAMMGMMGFGNADSGETKMAVSLSAKAPLDMIKSLDFLDLQGKVIKHRRTGGSSMGFTGHMSYETTYGLAQKVPKLKLQVVQFERVEVLKVPLSLEVGLGL